VAGYSAGGHPSIEPITDAAMLHGDFWPEEETVEDFLRVALISFMTVAELERWALQCRWSAQRLQWLRLYLHRFTVVPSSPDLCRKWAEVMTAAQAAGRRIECADAWIAATAVLRIAASRFPATPPGRLHQPQLPLHPQGAVAQAFLPVFLTFCL
jgi:predicted nucleic acid-binding protein